MPEVPLLQSLLEDVAAELSKYRQYWKKRREQYKTHWTNVLEKFKICLDFFEFSLPKIDKQEPKDLKQKQQELNEEADPAKAGFARQE